MAQDEKAWRDGRSAWERLDGWQQDRPPPGREAGGEDALAALADVGVVRRLLDQTELVAVRTARRCGTSWAEIATRLGVTRQSAWERWRELDEDQTSSDTRTDSDVLGDVAADLVESAVAGLVEQGPGIPEPDVPERVGRRARAARRRATVVVPNVIGLRWNRAREVLFDGRLVAVGPDPDGLPPAAAGWPRGVVTDQSPEAGARVPAGSAVILWLGDGGGGGGSAGDREPRNPKPTPKTARAAASR